LTYTQSSEPGSGGLGSFLTSATSGSGAGGGVVPFLPFPFGLALFLPPLAAGD
jgi:hypothetical protein